MTNSVRLPEEAGRLTTGLFLTVPIVFAMMVAFSIYTDNSLSPISWYLARATGITLYLLFWGIVVTGLLLTTHSLHRIVGKATLLSTHIYLGHLAYSFLAAHLLSLVTDEYLPFSLVQLLVPFRGPSPEPWTGLGVLGMYLFIVVVASASMRRYVPYPFWRVLHVLAFPMYALSLVHGIGVGSSSNGRIMQAVYVVSTTVVVALCLARLSRWRPSRPDNILVEREFPIDRLGSQKRLPPVRSERAL